jgi:hypothetical protein
MIVEVLKWLESAILLAIALLMSFVTFYLDFSVSRDLPPFAADPVSGLSGLMVYTVFQFWFWALASLTSGYLAARSGFLCPQGGIGWRIGLGVGLGVAVVVFLSIVGYWQIEMLLPWALTTLRWRQWGYFLLFVLIPISLMICDLWLYIRIRGGRA